MARVPTYGNRQISPTPLPTVRRTPQQEGAGVAGAMAGFGDTIASVGLAATRQIQQVIEQERLRADRTAVTAAEQQLGELEYLVLDAPDRGLFNTMKGKDALGVRDKAFEDFDMQADMIASTLTSDRARDAFQLTRDRRRLSMQEKIGAYTSRELDAYETGVAKASINTAANLAIANANDPQRIAEELARIEAITTQHAGRLGISSPEVKESFLAEIRSKVHVGVIERLLAQGQTQAASDYFAETRGQIDGDAMAQVERALHVDNTKKQAQIASDRIVAEGGTYEEQRAKAKQIDNADVRDLTLDYIDEEDRVKDRQKREAEEARSVRLSSAIEAKGLKGIPSTDWAAMGREERSAWRSYAKSLAENGGSAAIKTDYGTLYDLLTLSSVNQDAFLKTNLLKYRNQLSNGDLEQMMRKQADMRGGKSGSEIFASEGIQNEVIDAGLRAIGLDIAPAELRKPEKAAAAARVDAFRRRVREAVDRHVQMTGKKASRDDIQRIVDTLTVETRAAVDGWFVDTPAQYGFEHGQVQRADQVPAGERRKIEAALRKHGMPVTIERIVQLFNAQLAQTRGDR